MSRGEAQPTLLDLAREAGRSPGALWSIRERLTRPNRLSGSYLGRGFLSIAVLLAVRGIVSYLWSLDARSASWVSGVSWLLVLAASAAGVAIALRRHGELPRRAFTAVLAVDVVALVLEFADHALPAPAPLYYPTVCVGVGAGVIALIAFHPLSRSFLALALLVVLTALGLVGQALLGDGGAALAVSNILLAIAPAALCIVVLTALDQYVRRTLDRTLVADPVRDPREDEFSQVDARIEELLERVRTEGGIDGRAARRARVLGDELRGALARSHDRTWLRIAVEESALLSSAVTVEDPSGAATLLPPLDRSRLLSVLWLLTAPATAVRPALAVRLEESAVRGDVDVTLTATGLRERDLDRSVWAIISELGEYRTTTERGGTRIRVAHRPGRRTTP